MKTVVNFRTETDFTITVNVTIITIIMLIFIDVTVITYRLHYGTVCSVLAI